MKPITPEEVSEKKLTIIPDEVIDSFNHLIAKNYGSGSSSVSVKGVITEIFKRNPKELVASDTPSARQQIIENRWLDVEDIYRAAGWKVEFHSPDRDESFDSFYKFTKNRGSTRNG